MATTKNVAVCPAMTVSLAGFDVMAGGWMTGLTVSVALLLVVVPGIADGDTESWPLLADVVAAVVKEDEVAALTAAPFIFH